MTAALPIYESVDGFSPQSTTEEALYRSQQQLRGLMDSIPADVTLKDIDGRYIMINRATSNERRRSEADVLGKTAYELYPKVIAEHIHAQEREVVRTQKSVAREYQLCGKDGIERIYWTVKFPILDASGAPGGIGTTSTDITEHRHVQRQLEEYRERVSAELEMARQTQSLLIPSRAQVENISATHGLKVDSHFEPSSELGGDLWALRSLDGKRVAVITADFSGHGVNAALNTFRLHSFLTDIHLPARDPARFLRSLNERLRDLLPGGQFATMFCGIIDRASSQLVYAAAGAPNPISIGPNACGPRFEDSAGLPLGLFPDAVYDNRKIAFPCGASLLLYSDALTESMLTIGERVGEATLRRWVDESLSSQPRERLLRSLLSRFDTLARRPLKDDLTAVHISRRA